jgi:tRNA(Ile)-lysidine synthase
VSLQTRLAEALAGMLPGDDTPEGERRRTWPRIGVAVSGGGDSLALLDLLHEAGVAVAVASVDHGLRPQARDEMALVARYCAARGLDHAILTWRWDGHGNVQDAARQGRGAAIAQWAQGCGIGHVALGHTADDQAETVLMRLARGSGVDGLAAMAPVAWREGITWLRPLLEVRRAELRDYLRAQGLRWAEDPSNEDTGYARVRVRQAIAALDLDVARLTRTAAHMARARAALEYGMAALARTVVTLEAGDVVIEAAPFDAAPDELRARLLAEALCWVSGQSYRPRHDALVGALEAARPVALHGCLVIRKGGRMRILREWKAVAAVSCALGEPWDGRWRLIGPGGKGMKIRALGEGGLRECPGWRDGGLPRQSVISSPAVWRDAVLVAAPFAGLARGWRAVMEPERADFPGLGRDQGQLSH